MMSKKSINNRKGRTVKTQAQAPNRWPTTMGRRRVNRGTTSRPRPAGKRTVSSRKVEANRSNARKSTGPKTAAGKKRVSKNATKHGFYSKHLLVQHQDGGESQGEYDDFEADVVKHFQPVGWLEKNWVDKIAVWSWRLRQAQYVLRAGRSLELLSNT